ncbi:hypothetical protein G7025_21430 [Pseudomonas lurida]|uniref:hypothetical protein n=1 Tax=Pseudomonas TaxID=286 RepID=UPI0015E34F55|nr:MULTISPECIES: hypothetical protein [Pseudomonas]MBA1295933.1 hypothetical protein [Pseudomonas lurida]
MILFRDAVSMVDQSALQAERLEKSGCGEKVLSLAHFAFGSLFRPISADDGASAYRVAGRNPRIQNPCRGGHDPRRHQKSSPHASANRPHGSTSSAWRSIPISPPLLNNQKPLKGLTLSGAFAFQMASS